MDTTYAQRASIRNKVRRYVAALFAQSKSNAIVAAGAAIKPDVRFSLSGKPIVIHKLVKNNTLTLAEIFKRIPKDRLHNAKRDYVTLTKFVASKKSVDKLLSATETHEQRGKKSMRRIHKQAIVRLEPEKPFFKSKCKVTCTCEDFMFTWEYALWRRGNSEIIYSNGEAPTIKNPRLVAGACKHMSVIIRHIIRNKIDKRQKK